MRRRLEPEGKRPPEVGEQGFAEDQEILEEETPLQERLPPAEDAPEAIVYDIPIAVEHPPDRPIPVQHFPDRRVPLHPAEIRLANIHPEERFHEGRPYREGDGTIRRNTEEWRNAFVLGIGTGVVLTLFLIWMAMIQTRPRRRRF
ncbi:uncharacterized protein LOC129957507 [Argiope bruennichi]|uniref:uncharacterized protein LOC129957507 n=1 Tax=Argiope bruennichi TaxID=94029 RepID=UPI0024959F58|nr:uncharacterized protein LOC129957507 [Argiope bruennichi]XP_055925814.1 uncharacterized protein LOC129957507 [Argiope bruennichi]